MTRVSPTSSARSEVRFQITVTGSEPETIKVRPINIIAAELVYGTDAQGKEMRSTLFACWDALERPQADFDAWLRTVDDVQRLADEGVDPTGTAPSDEGSPTSL